IVDERVGDRVVLAVADAQARALAGQAVFLPATSKQRFAAEPMAFMLVPVRDEGGKATAGLAWRIAARRMAEILDAARVGGTGERYAVDADGRMVTDSRFSEHVAKLGLLPEEARGRTAAYLEVRDPGHPLAAGESFATPQKTWPPTWAAAEVLAGRSGAKV